MPGDILAHNPERLNTLAQRTRDTVTYLDETICDDPATADAIATIRTISHRLTTMWMPVFARIGADTSMTGWDSAGPTTTPVRGFNGGWSGDLDELTDDEFLAVLTQAAAESPSLMMGAQPIPPELVAELADRWDELEPLQQQAAILALLAFGGWPAATYFGTGPLTFLEASLDEMYIDPEFAAAFVQAAAAIGEVPPELQPLADRIAVEYGDELALALNGVDDPALFAALGVHVSFNVDPQTVGAFLTVVDHELAAAIESRQLFDTAGFTLAGSVVAENPDGGTWAGDVGWLATSDEIGGYYEGGGYLIAPDGHAYPIVITTLTTEEGTFTADLAAAGPGEPSVANLGGEDDGWTVVGCASGVERIVEPPDGADYGAVILAGSAVELQAPPPNSGLSYIVVDPNGLPHLSDEPAPSGQSVSIPDVSDLNPANAAVAVVNMAANAGVVATSLDNQSESAYIVVFEQNEDGRRRAQIVTYNLGTTFQGETVIVPSHLYVGDGGRLTTQLVSYVPPAPDGVDIYDFCFTGYDMHPSPIPEAVFP